MRLQSPLRIAHDPDALLRAVDAGLSVVAQAVLDLETRFTEGDRTVDRHVVAEPGGSQKTRARAHQWKSGEVELLEHLELGDPERVLEHPRGRRIENVEIARIENDAGRVAVAPLDADLVRAGEGGHDSWFP